MLFQCNDCGKTFEADCYAILREGYSCPICGDKISFNNKLMYNICLEANLDKVKREYSLIKGRNEYKYDVYFETNNKEYLIEMDGGFHKKPHPKSKKTIEEIRAIDKEKDELAKKHNIKLIRIDCDTESHEEIVERIKQSYLKYIINFNLIDFNQCVRTAEKNLVKKICEYYKTSKDMISIGEMSKKFDCDRSTITKYLRKGNKFGWCIYPRISKKIIVYDENNILLGIFSSAKKCCNFFFKKYNIVIKRWIFYQSSSKKQISYKNLKIYRVSFDNIGKVFIN